MPVSGGSNSLSCDIDLNFELIYSFKSDKISEISSIIKSRDNNIILGGSYGTEAILAKYNVRGENIWTSILETEPKQYDFYNDTLVFLKETKNNDIIAIARLYATEIIGSNKEVDIGIIKYNAFGEIQNIKYFGGNKYDNTYADKIEISDYGDIKLGIYVRSSDIPYIDNPNNYFLDRVIVYREGEEDVARSFNELNSNSSNINKSNISDFRNISNKLEEGLFKDFIQEKLNNMRINETLDHKNATANLDIYIKSENMLLMSLSTNSITFEDFSGVEDLEKLNAVDIVINSSLPYQLNSYLISEIQNADGSNKIDIDRLNIKESSSDDYKTFNNINEKLVLKDDCTAGNGKTHSVDLRLSGSNAHVADIYKTVIKFEAEQK